VAGCDVTGADIKRPWTLTTGLGFVAGYVDTVGFVALFGLFTAHVTGNFVLIGAALVQSSGNVLLKLLVFPAFILAVALARLFVLWLERRGREPLVPTLLVQAALLVGFMLLGWWASPVRDSNAPLAIWAGLAGAAAMGVQNAAARLLLAALAPTTVMTGNVTQLVIDAVDLSRGAADDVVRKRSVKFAGAIVAFGLGAIGGAFGYLYVGFWALLAPIVILLVLMLACSGRDVTVSGAAATPQAGPPLVR
jgi:uncharacterized membrane protein YoaK (UPF0700 family)